MQTRPVIYNAVLSSQNVTARSKVTVTVLAEDMELFTTEVKYARNSDYELMSGQEIGVI